MRFRLYRARLILYTFFNFAARRAAKFQRTLPARTRLPRTRFFSTP